MVNAKCAAWCAHCSRVSKESPSTTDDRLLDSTYSECSILMCMYLVLCSTFTRICLIYTKIRPALTLFDVREVYLHHESTSLALFAGGSSSSPRSRAACMRAFSFPLDLVQNAESPFRLANSSQTSLADGRSLADHSMHFITNSQSASDPKTSFGGRGGRFFRYRTSFMSANSLRTLAQGGFWVYSCPERQQTPKRSPDSIHTSMMVHPNE